MNFYQSLGSLVLGTRFRRLSEYFLSEVNKVYLRQGILFEASWFGIFYILENQKEVSIIDISEALDVSHSSVSQLVKILIEKKLVIFETSKYDARKKIVCFTPEGQQLLIAIKPVWSAIESAMNDLLLQENCEDILAHILKIENAFNYTSLQNRICLNMAKTPSL